MITLLVNIKQTNLLTFKPEKPPWPFWLMLSISLWISTAPLVIASNDEALTVGCSDWKPYCYSVDGQLQGRAYTITQQIMDASQVEYDFKFYPWNRIYQLAMKTEDHLIVGLGRTNKRENHFTWITPVRKPAKIFAYQLKNSPVKINTESDLLNYLLAVERGSFTHDYLLALGYDRKKLITVSRMKQLLMMAQHGRIDGFILDESVFESESIKNNIDAGLFKKSFLAFEVTEYLAASKNISAEVVNKIKKSYHHLIQNKVIQLPD